MTARMLEGIAATTDVHSALDRMAPMLACLQELRRTSLVVDCGDFFEGTGYYRLGGGSVERQILCQFYDVVAPGNHGWFHHFEPDLYELTTCCNAVDIATGRLLFHPLRVVDVGVQRVAVTAIIGPQAFTAIPADQRLGHHVIDPAQALRELRLRHPDVDAWVLLSHSGFTEDLKLAAACPFLDIIFSGHCHGERYGPEYIGDTLVVKGLELGAGYATVKLLDARWVGQIHLFPAVHESSESLKSIVEQITSISRQLATPLGLIDHPWRDITPERRTLLTATAEQLRADSSGVSAVILNETALRPAALGEILRLEDLLAIEPFGNYLVQIVLPKAVAGDVRGMMANLIERAGPLVTSPDPLAQGTHALLTTKYLAEGIPAHHRRETGVYLGEIMRQVLCGRFSSKTKELRDDPHWP